MDQLHLLVKLQDEFHLSYLFISHNLDEVEHISDRVGIMYLGKIVEIAPSKNIYSEPQHPYTKALLSAIPIPDPKADLERTILPVEVEGFIGKAYWQSHPACLICYRFVSR